MLFVAFGLARALGRTARVDRLDYLAAGAAVGAAVAAAVAAAEAASAGAGGLAWGSSTGAVLPPQATARAAMVMMKGVRSVLVRFMGPE